MSVHPKTQYFIAYPSVPSLLITIWPRHGDTKGLVRMYRVGGEYLSQARGYAASVLRQARNDGATIVKRDGDDEDSDRILPWRADQPITIPA
jgi:hypothetical protein